VVLRAGRLEEYGALGPFDLGSDGSCEDLIMIRTGGSREPLHTVSTEKADPYFRMCGKAAFLHAVERMATSARTVLSATGWPGGRPDVVVTHQANLRLIHALADMLDIAREHCVVNLDRIGNTVAASIPLALADGVASGSVRSGDRVLLTAFGGGLTWGSCALRWPVVSSNSN
jgi:3-oxoacyl-[acyl-carrier-protein] synthase-3